jgi:signal transduction histidine kinase
MPPMASRRVTLLLAKIISLALLYLVFGRLGLFVAAIHKNVTFVWPAAGIALAALLIGGFRLLPGVFLGAFLVNVLTDIPWYTALSIACGNTLEALLGAFLLRRVLGLQNAMERLRDVLGLIILGGIISTTAASLIGVASLSLQGSASSTDFARLWFEWWIGDMLGILVLAPFLLTWSEPGSLVAEARKSPWKILEAVVLFLLMLCMAQIIFGGWVAPRLSPHPHSYLMFPFLIWAAIRFGPKGAATATLAVSAFAVWGTVRGFGPFADSATYEGLFFLQLFMAVVVLTMLVLAATTSERKRSEEAKSEFASMVSHELRTPLSSIKAGIELVLDGIEGPITGAQQETLGVAKRNVNRLTRLINNVLDYSKLESGKMEMLFEKTDLSKLLDETYELMKFAVQTKQIAFVRELPQQPVFAVCDDDKIKQVVINLLDNAIKFTGEGGRIALRLKHTDRNIVIEVEDNGIGIKPEDQEKIFEMFGQVSPRGKSRGHGSGIGLAVCRLIVEHHQGKIDIQSAPGRGSRLAVIFPDSLPEKKKAVPLK